MEEEKEYVKKEEKKEEKQRRRPSPLCSVRGCWAACRVTRFGSPRQPQPRPACQPTYGPTVGSFALSSGERAPRRHGATRVFFNTTIPLTMTSKSVTAHGGTHE